MHRHPDVITSLQTELYDWRLWSTRAVVLAFASLAGLTVVAFTLLSEQALAAFHAMNVAAWWAPLLLTPACTAAIVWCTHRYAPGARGHPFKLQPGSCTVRGADGIAVAFNTPLGGILFAIEELTRKPGQRSNGLVMAAIVLGGLMAVSVFVNSTYFGVIPSEKIGFSLLLPGLLVALACGLAGGLFSRLLIISLSGVSNDWFSRMRKRSPIYFAAACGLVVAIIGLSTNGGTFGSGYTHTRAMLEGTDESTQLYVLLKFVATWLSTWSGVPAGIFAPSLAIGGALGNDVALWTGHAQSATLIALGMAGFLAAVTQAPITAFVIVMEMVDGHGLVLSLMACALLASAVSRLVSAPLYASLADLQLKRIPTDEAPKP